MTRAAFFCFPGHGHVNPTLPLVEELVRRGEVVDYHCIEEFRAVIEATGARYVPLPGPIQNIATLLVPGEGFFRLGEFVAEITLGLVPLLRDALATMPPDYVMYDAMTPWGRLVAQALRLPAITTYPSFATLPEKLPLPPVPILLLAMGIPALGQNIRRWRRRDALTREVAQRFGVDRLGFSNIISNPSGCNIVFTSEAFQVNRKNLDERFHFVGATLSEPSDPSFPIAALDGRRVIYVSLGTVFNTNLAVYRACFEAFDGPNDTVVVGAGKGVDLSALGAIPENCIVRAHVPQLAVLGKAALFITHGGMNSVTAGLYNGVPMLVLPQGADNSLNAGRLEQLRAARRIRTADLKPARLRRLADEIIGDATLRENIRALGDSLRNAGGATRAADVVFQYRDRVTGAQ